MKGFGEYKQWIKEHMPDEVTEKDLDNCALFYWYGHDGLTVFCEGDRGNLYQVYRAQNKDDLLYWAYKECCRELTKFENVKKRCEAYLWMMRFGLPDQEWEKEVKSCEMQMNRDYVTTRWGYDEKKGKFARKRVTT